MTTKRDMQDPLQGPFRSLEELADSISDTLQCPITIEDASHRILAYSTHDVNVDEARIATIMRRKVPENVIKTLWKRGIIPQLLESDEPVIIPAIEEVGLGNRVAIAVRKSEEVLGFIWAQVDRNITENEVDLLKRAAQLVKHQKMQLQMKKRKDEQSHREFFWQLLTGHLQDNASIYSSEHYPNMQIDGEISIVVFDFGQDIDQSIERNVRYYVQAAQQMKVVFNAIDDNQMIFLVQPSDAQQPAKQLTAFVRAFVEDISERLEIASITGGVGTLYREPVRIKDSYREALYVLSMKERFPQEISTIYNYQDLGIYQFIDVLYEQRMRTHHRNYFIEKLKQYDETNHTQLLETIEIYLQYDNNINDASKALHVHPNTLNYRLKRISEITEMNLKDPNQKMTLYLDLKIERLK
ncbi:PucR family transcriptional regulator [Pontibacillus litoralis]|uniref:PucR family transcriptional regulator n=1 Tax=Pontibacillus litoralis JSM 072002 TaxID=1385512 RepID=A0A0A5G0A3_9BACI|nr:helix-turn-helix domain-containing protein [Pontibacillus litoralis]KGX86506.1 hypothetical protein N784_04945 [Pontibacillus litoralis JSM 072002]